MVPWIISTKMQWKSLFKGAFTRQVHQHQGGLGGEVQPDGHPGPENQPHSGGRLQLLQGAGRQNFLT